MAEQSTYSFLDVVGAIHSPAMASDYIFTGEGVGSITIDPATDRTAHDVAADGSVMVSKIAGDNGTITIETQQTSPVHKWLKEWFKAIWNSKTSNWANTTILITENNNGTAHIISGVSPSKKPSTPYQAQGQRVTWTLMAADIQDK